MFSYFTQRDECFLYEDWRRQTSIYMLVAIVFGTLIYTFPFIAAVDVDVAKSHEKDIWNKLIILAGTTTILILLASPVIHLLSKNKVNFDEGHPNLKGYAIFVSSVLILGSTMPLMSFLGSKIIAYRPCKDPPPVVIPQTINLEY